MWRLWHVLAVAGAGAILCILLIVFVIMSRSGTNSLEGSWVVVDGADDLHSHGTINVFTASAFRETLPGQAVGDWTPCRYEHDMIVELDKDGRPGLRFYYKIEGNTLTIRSTKSNDWVRMQRQ